MLSFEFTLLTKHDCWEAKRKLFYQMGFLTLFYYEINFQHRFAVVDVPPPISQPPGLAIFQYHSPRPFSQFSPPAFEHVFTLVFLWSCLSPILSFHFVRAFNGNVCIAISSFLLTRSFLFAPIPPPLFFFRLLP